MAGLFFVSAVLGALRPAAAQGQGRKPNSAAQALFVVVDDDDDDDDGVTDREQEQQIPADDLVQVPPSWLQGATQIRLKASGEARLVASGRAVKRVDGTQLRGDLGVQGLRSGSCTLHVYRGDEVQSFPVEVIAIAFLDGANKALLPAKQDASVSLHITNSLSLPPADDLQGISADLRNLRFELSGPSLAGSRQSLKVAQIPAHRDAAPPVFALSVRLKRKDPRGPFRSPFVRLVADATDQQAPGVHGRVLQVALRDRLRATWNSPSGPLSQDIRVGMRSPGRFTHSALRGEVRLTVLRTAEGGPPVVGGSADGALSVLRAQLKTANQIWAQCGVTFGPLGANNGRVVAPPPPALLAVGDGNGLPARGDGVIAFLADGVPVGPIATERNARPVDTAMSIARALQDAGFAVEVTQNPRTQYGVYPSADVLVRTAANRLARLSLLPRTPLSTDSRQRLAVGMVDLTDGLSEFDNMNARAGTLEERTLIKSLADRDPTTIDVFIINHFRGGTRQGEAFIEASGGPLVNVVILDRNGLKQRDSAFTMAHELGHILLDQPLHPDNVGPDRPWLLMDADSSRGTVYGPKRLTDNDCLQVVYVSGPQAQPPLLQPWKTSAN